LNAWTGYGIIVAIMSASMSTDGGRWVGLLIASVMGFMGLRQERQDREDR